MRSSNRNKTSKFYSRHNIDDLEENYDTQQNQQQKQSAQSLTHLDITDNYNTNNQQVDRLDQVVDLDNDQQNFNPSNQNNNNLNNQQQQDEEQQNRKQRRQLKQYTRNQQDINLSQQQQQNQSSSKLTDIDINNLNSLGINNTSNVNQGFYEPGQQNLKNCDNDLPILDKVDDKFRVQEQENIGNLKINQNELPAVEQLKDIPQSQNKKDDDEKIIFSESSDSDNEGDKKKQQNKNQEKDQKDQEVQQQIKHKKSRELEKFSSDEDEEEEIDNNIKNIQQKNNSQEQQEQQQRVQKPKTIKLLTSEIIKLDSFDKIRHFLLTPIVKGHVLQCTVYREQSGLSWFAPKFHLKWDGGDNQLLMSAKKMSGNKAPNFMILQADNNKQDDFSKMNPNFIGKVKGQFMGNQYHIYDTGLNKDKFKTQNPNLARKELALMQFDQNANDKDILTKITVLIPKIDPITHIPLQEFQSLDNETSLASCFKSENLKNVVKLVSKKPQYNFKDKTYYLDMGPRVQKQSIKNYQLIDEGIDSSVYFTSGRSAEDNKFIMDVEYPFSPLQAFGIMLAGLTYKP